MAHEMTDIGVHMFETNNDIDIITCGHRHIFSAEWYTFHAGTHMEHNNKQHTHTHTWQYQYLSHNTFVWRTRTQSLQELREEERKIDSSTVNACICVRFELNVRVRMCVCVLACWRACDGKRMQSANSRCANRWVGYSILTAALHESDTHTHTQQYVARARTFRISDRRTVGINAYVDNGQHDDDR